MVSHWWAKTKDLSVCPFVRPPAISQRTIIVNPNPNLCHSSILRKPKDKFSKELSTGVIYKINCKNCDKVYIGQTSRALRSRTREHKRAIFTGDRNSLLTATLRRE